MHIPLQYKKKPCYRLSKAVKPLQLVIETITDPCLLNKHVYVISITVSLLCRACMEADKTVVHVLIECIGITQIKLLGSPISYMDVLNKPRDLYTFMDRRGNHC